MVTIKEVAREAGVSLGTASQAVRQSRRGLAVATPLRYQPSALARGLLTRRTHTVGPLLPDVANPLFIRAMRAAEDLAQENRHNRNLCNTGEDLAKQSLYLQVLTEKEADGVLSVANLAGSANPFPISSAERGGAPVQVAGYRTVSIEMEDRWR